MVDDPRSLLVPAPRGTCPFAPPPAYERMRRAGSIAAARLPHGDRCWVATGASHVRSVLLDGRFSADPRNAGFPFLSRDHEVVAKIQPTFLRLDDPEHARFRRLIARDFTAKVAEQQRHEVTDIVNEVLVAMIAKGPPADLVTEFALVVPAYTVCMVLGVPRRDYASVERLASTAVDTRTPARTVQLAQHKLTTYFTELAAYKRRAPDDSLFARLAASDLDDQECATMAMVLLIAGHETTANTISMGMLALQRHPDQAAMLHADPALIPNAVEELLRYTSVVHLGLPRTALADVELDSTVIPAGEGVLCQLSTANRDETVFPRAADLDLSRHTGGHLAFGYGVHQCIGKPLARVELQAAFTALLRRLPGLRLAVPYEELEYRTEHAVYGVVEMPVAWDADQPGVER